MAARGLRVVAERHTCRHRAFRLLEILEQFRSPRPHLSTIQYGGGRAMRICFFGSSLVSSYWNGAAATITAEC